MQARSALRVLLLLVVVGSLVAFGIKRAKGPGGPVQGAAASETSTDTVPADVQVLVTYFTTDVRCTSCRTIEELSRRAIEEGFPQELASGAVAFRVINTDLPEHAHFVDEYGLTNKTVIVSHRREGRELEYTDRQDVWLLLDEPEPFYAYVREPVRAYLAQG
jgi:hypothetical protein